MNTIKFESDKSFPFYKQLQEIVDNIIKTSNTDIIFDPNFIAIDYFSRFNKYNDLYNRLLLNYPYEKLFYLFSNLFYDSSNKLINDIISKTELSESRDYINAVYLKKLREQSKNEDNSLIMIEIDSYISYKSNNPK